MDLGLTDKRALVAAASDGLGFAVAHALAAEGCSVAICARDGDHLQAAATRIVEDTGATIHPGVCDVSNGDAVRRWVDESVDKLGGSLEIVVPNAGGPPAGTFADTTEEGWESAFQLLLMSAIRFAAASRPHMRPGSNMLFMTSISLREPIANLTYSSVMRPGVAALAKALANEWVDDGIRVNHLIPGTISTPRIGELHKDLAARQGITEAEVAEARSAQIPMGRYGTPDEFASAAVFLVSGAASYITGATLQVDGGKIKAVF